MDNDLKYLAGGAVAIFVLVVVVLAWSDYSKRSAWQSCLVTMKDKPAAEILAVCR